MRRKSESISSTVALSFYRPHESCEIPCLPEIYAELFGLRQTGTFVEIGGYDGVTFSNTSFLADMGWRGIYVEPVEEYARACAHNHRNNNVAVYNLGVAHRSGKAQVSVARSVTSMSRAHIAGVRSTRWGKRLHKGCIRTVEVVTAEQIFAQAGIADFELLVVDVEGSEWPVMQGFDIKRRRPAVAIVEVQDMTPAYGPDLVADSRRVIDHFIDHGYRVHARTGKDIVFANDDLIEALPSATPR